jgi:hypothetical protein
MNRVYGYAVALLSMRTIVRSIMNVLSVALHCFLGKLTRVTQTMIHDLDPVL